MARQKDHLSRFSLAMQAGLPAVRIPIACAMVGALSLFLICMFFLPAQAWAANRSLTLHNTHTKETTTITYKRNGKFDADGLRRMNRFLRDWRRNESRKMDPALFDLIWEVYRRTGAKKPIHVVSGYRSPATNKMLRRRSRAVAKNSRHTMGQAMDFYIPGVATHTIRNAGLRLQAGGVGYYPRSRSPFVHIDTGNVRHWPRMTRKQLASVFPKGKTVHVPKDGKPFSGYKTAKAQVAKRKAAMVRTARSVGRFKQVAKAAPAATKRTARPSKVQLAKLAATKKKSETTLLQKLLNKTPKERPNTASTAANSPAPVNLVEPDNSVEEVAGRQTILPSKLAALPKRPQNRPKQTPLAVASAVTDEPAPEEEPTADSTAEGTPPVIDEKPVLLASLPRARTKRAAETPFQLASAEPGVEPKSLNELAAEKTQPDTPPETATERDQDRFVLASLPQARTPDSLPEATLQQAALSKPATTEESATDILKKMTEDTNTENQQEDSSRFSYASADKTFVAALPSTAPRKLIANQNAGQAQEVGLETLPKQAERTQLASLSDIPALLPEPKAPPRPAQPKRAPSRAKTNTESNQLAKLTFAYGPSGMAHFAHMKQSTKTATFARLSRPIPNNLKGLVTKPNSMIISTFSHQPSDLVGDRQFAGAAIARMAVRSFN